MSSSLFFRTAAVLLTASQAFALLPALALAGPNAGGTLVAHDASLAYTIATSSYCGLGISTLSCIGVDPTLEGTSSDTPKVWKILAVFEPGSSPRLAGVCFGIQYDSTAVALTDQGPCVGDLEWGGAEYPDPEWPVPDTGIVLVFQWTQTERLVEVYWFAGHLREGISEAVFRLRPHPDPRLLGHFGDDSIPAVLDPIAAYGTLGFETAGVAPCPAAEGACCSLRDGSCSVASRSDCEVREDHEFRAGACDPNPCGQDAPCCIVGRRGECVQMPPSLCLAEGNSPGLIGETCQAFHGHCDVALGACCDGAVCAITTWDDCWGTSRPWVDGQGCLPQGGVCLQEWGACCDGADCIITPRSDCDPGVFRLDQGCYPGQGGNIERCVALPAETISWGRIKSIYNEP